MPNRCCAWPRRCAKNGYGQYLQQMVRQGVRRVKIVDDGTCRAASSSSRACFGDARGFFYESYNAEKYKSAGLDLRFVQTNVSRSAHGVLRGLHYQWPNPQGKLVSVLEGEVYDVAVDIRTDRRRSAAGRPCC